MDTLLQLVLILSAVLLILLIMIRKGDSGGLSGAFGGMGGDTAFGVKTQKQLDKVITYIAIVFIGSAIFLNTPNMRSQMGSTSTTTTTTTTPEGTTTTTPPAESTPAESTPANNE